MIEEAETVRLAVRAAVFTGSNQDEIRAFIGAENVITDGARLQIRLSGGTWQDIHPGWRAMVFEDGEIGICSERSYIRHYKPRYREQ